MVQSTVGVTMHTAVLGDGTQTNRYEIVQSILPSSDPAVAPCSRILSHLCSTGKWRNEVLGKE